MARYQWSSLVIVLAIIIPLAATPVCGRTLSFSGATWTVKTSTRKAGPGPNYFSDSDRNVSVDGQGRLHLWITHNKDRWDCAEVIHTASLGYGTYRFYLDSPVDKLDPNVVLGLFTWNDEPAYAHREIDIELSRWSKLDNLNAQYVVQPFTSAEHRVRFSQPPGLDHTTHQFCWHADSIFFQSLLLRHPIPRRSSSSGRPRMVFRSPEVRTRGSTCGSSGVMVLRTATKWRSSSIGSSLFLNMTQDALGDGVVGFRA